MEDDFFGSDDQRALLTRGRGMAALLGDDPRFSYYGRKVGLVTQQDGDVDQLAALVTVQGNSNDARVPLEAVDAVKAALKAQGLAAMHYAKWEGGPRRC